MATRKKPAAGSTRTIERLRRRLHEAEETLDAIRNGNIDALVVRAPDGEQIYTLRTADQPYRLMVEQMREGALTLAADGTVLYCNQRFAELMALPPERITGRNLADFVEAGEVPHVRAMLDAPAFRSEFQLRSALGTANPVQVSSTALYIDDVRTVAVVITDLTPERTERALRESNRLKDEFLATLSHELRTPLNVILGWTRMMLGDQMAPGTRRHALELIDRNAQAQAQLVNDLVDMSRITTGKLRVALEPLPVMAALDGVLESIRPAAQAKSLTVEASCDVEDVHVLADATRIQQVLWNLLSNAVKFTPDGGRISVSARRVGDRVRIEIADTGIGIDRAFLPHVFDRFRQGDSGTTRRYGGLGLGLAIVHDLVRLHGGDVEAQSEGVGHGATFAVTLRATEAPSQSAGRRPGAALESLAGQRILLVEDHADSRELVTHAMRQAGATVTGFAAAGEAFDALERVRPTVIVADIGLPGEDGHAFIRRVRAHPVAAIRRVPAIALTAYASTPDRADALAAGFQQYLSKPVDPGYLAATIREVTAGARHEPRLPSLEKS